MCEQCDKINSSDVVGGDDLVAIVMPRTMNAVQIIPKQHAPLEELPTQTQQRLITTANMLSSFIFETMQAHGTNILVYDEQHAVYTLISRIEQDGIDFRWQPTRTTQAELKDTAERISNEAFVVGKEPAIARPRDIQREIKVEQAKRSIETQHHAHEPKAVDEPRDVAADIDTKVEKIPKENYLIKHLNRRR